MRVIRSAIIVATFVLCASYSQAKVFVVDDRPSTIRSEAGDSAVILFGRFESPRPKGVTAWETDFIVHEVLKDHPIIKDRKVLTLLLRKIPDRNDGKANYFLIFGDIYKGQLDFFRGYQADEQAVRYVRDILRLDAKKPAESLRFFLDRLDATNIVIADDVYRELKRAPDDVLRDAARTLAPAKLWPILRSEDVDPSRRNEVGGLLAYCGKREDADELWKLHETLTPARARVGLYFAILTLNPKDYAAKVKAVAKDEKLDFTARYSVWLATRKLYETKNKSMSESDLLDLAAVFLDQRDMADFPMDAFIKWKRWDYTERILKIQEKDWFSTPIIRVGMIRYAIACPQPAAKAFVEKMRKEDPERVKYYEEENGCVERKSKMQNDVEPSQLNITMVW